ncbi:RluA family pseudouridine synthase [Rubritalea marina]|uniref:RluA family pseudouridine synthase n=1 Tax=Rubritalea marina TaxID=361055 RepID=UPI00035C5D19|nr:RNA pseudouridine synthase [Rubritalea marina]
MIGGGDRDCNFAVVDESDDWIVVDKAAPLIVHPTNNKREATLLCGLQELLVYELANGAALSLMNRLDRETSGLVLVAKNKSAARQFGRAMERRQIHKEYEALVFGWPEWDDFTVEEPILRKGEVMESPIWLKQSVHPAGKACRTEFQVFERRIVHGEKVSWLHVLPHTGRMHQIRVHAEYAGFPLIGDKIYGPDEHHYLEHIERGWTEEMQRALYLKRHALHASHLHVRTDDLELRWSCPMADDLKRWFQSGIY